MENQKLIQILYCIRACLSNEDWQTAKQYTILEIENLKDNTQITCKSKNESPCYCNRCINFNCNNNINNNY